MERLPSTTALQVFVEAAHKESFADAASTLNVTQAAVSKQIKNLESLLGIDLFERRHRQVHLTDRGAAYLPTAESVLRDLSLASQHAGSQQTYAELSVEIDHDLLTFWILPRMQDLQARLPGCQFNFTAPQITARRPNRYTDVAIVFGRPTWPGLNVEPILDYYAFPVCSPDLIDGPVDKANWASLKQRTLLHDHSKYWWDEALSKMDIPRDTSVTEILLGQPTVCLTAAMRGLGIAIGDDVTCRELLEDGSLVRLSDGTLPGRDTNYIVTQPGTPTSSIAHEFIDWLKEEEQEHIAWRNGFLGL